MQILHVDGAIVALVIKETIYIIDMDNMVIYDQFGSRLVIQNIDDWIHKSTMWTYGLKDLKLMVGAYNLGRSSIFLSDLSSLLIDFVTYLYENNKMAEINKIYDVEQLNLEAIDKVIIPNLRDNFEKIKTENGDLSMELFLKRLKKRLAVLNPFESRIVDGFLNRLNEQHVELKLAKPDILQFSADKFLQDYNVYKFSTEVSNLIDTIKKLRLSNLNGENRQTVLS